MPRFGTRALVGLAVALSLGGRSAHAQYDLPADRRVAWKAGSDLWNGGTLPVYPQVTCTPLAANGTTDDTAAINACIAAAGSNTAVYLPAGTYLVSGVINLKTGVALRGAGAAATVLKGKPRIKTPGGSITPALSYKVHVDGYPLAGSPKKGDTQVTLQTASQVNVGEWIAIHSDDDPALVNSTGTNGRCDWCGDNNGYHCIQQIVNVTAKSGATITLSRPLYYTPYVNPQVKRYAFGVQRAGVENLKLDGTADLGSESFIDFTRALHCWVKGVETNNSGSSNGSAHVHLAYSYGCEVRDSYFHDGRAVTGGVNYGVALFNVNSDHKIENNILRHHRHSTVFEGGGSGCAVLSNYIDDNYTSDTSYLGNALFNHGAHPYMNLFEGNIISHINADNVWGSSSHQVVFRNWLWGDETGTGVPSFPPTSGFVAIDIFAANRYYSYVGNVLGVTGMHTSWSNASVRPASPSHYPSASAPIVYAYDPSVSATSLNHGNYDYKTMGVAYWEGGAVHTLKLSLYYGAKPAWWCAETPWPPIGPDLTPVASDIPAKRRYEGKPCTTGVVPSDAGPPDAEAPDAGPPDVKSPDVKPSDVKPSDAKLFDAKPIHDEGPVLDLPTTGDLPKTGDLPPASDLSHPSDLAGDGAVAADRAPGPGADTLAGGCGCTLVDDPPAGSLVWLGILLLVALLRPR